MKTDLLPGISRAIRTVPELYDQNDWGEPNIEKHTCDTPACLAGWTVALYGNPQGFRRHASTASYADEILNLTEAESSILFNAYWPQRYFRPEDRHDEDPTLWLCPTAEQAADIIERIHAGEISITSPEDPINPKYLEPI